MSVWIQIRSNVFVWPDLGPKCKQRLSADNISRQRVNPLKCQQKFHLKMLLCIYFLSLKTKVIIEANGADPDQTAPIAVLPGSTLSVEETSKDNSW